MSNIPKMLVFTCLLGLIALPAQAKHNKPKSTVDFIPSSALSAIDKQHILQDHFVTVKTVKAIPKSVLSHLLGQYPEDGMADAGQPFQRTDVLDSPKPLPFRRLVFAALSEGYCLVYNEYGGFGEGTNVSLYRLSAGQATLEWKATLMNFSGSLSLSQLQSEINKGRFWDQALRDYTKKP